jgi:hypothetical protein
MSEKSNIQRMLDEQAAYQGKLAKDPVPDRGPARQEATRGPYEVAPHMKSYAPGDNTPAKRARQAAQDRARFGPPPKATRP